MLAGAKAPSGWFCPMHPQVHQEHPGRCPICGMQLVERSNVASPDSGASAQRDGREPLYWYDPMRPEQRFERPGKSPFMDMPLVAKYADEAASTTHVVVDPRMAQNLGMRTAAVRHDNAAVQLDVTGSVAVDERRIVTVEARAPGWIKRLAVRSAGESITAGQLIAEIYAPDLLAARQELALAEQLADRTLIAAARTRLQMLGGSPGDLSDPRSRLTAPQSGVVIELLVRQGEQVGPGTPLMRIADLSKVWIVVEVPQARSSGLRVGQAAIARVAGAAEQGRQASVDFVYPALDTVTRTVRARLSVDNADLRLKPGMYAEISLAQDSVADTLAVPSEAVIRTGTRNVVIVAEAQGRYRPVEVVLGEERGSETIVLDGLDAGQQVVVSGQFLIDSEASLQGAYQRMQGAGGDEQSPAAFMRNMGGETSPGAYEAHSNAAPQP